MAQKNIAFFYTIQHQLEKKMYFCQIKVSTDNSTFDK